MPIQIRHSTQQQNLPSAGSHGVGMPISDGGLGAVSRALGQVAGAAGGMADISARLQQKKDAVDKANSELKRLDRVRLINEEKIKLAGTTDSDERKVLESTIANLSDHTSKDFIPWVAEGEDPIDEKILAPYQNRVYGDYQDYYYRRESEKAAEKSVGAFLGLRTAKLHPLIEGVADGTFPADTIAEVTLGELDSITQEDIYSGAYGPAQSNFSKLLLEDTRQVAKAIEARIEKTTDPKEVKTLLSQLDTLSKGVNLMEGPEQSELVTQLSKASSREMKDLIDYPKVESALGAVQTSLVSLINTETSALDGSVISDARVRLKNNREFAGPSQIRRMEAYDHTFAELGRLQLPEHASELTKMLLSKSKGETVWTGDPEADQNVRHMFEQRFEKLAKKYDEALTPEDKWLLVSPTLERQKSAIFNKYPRAQALAKWRIITEDIAKQIGPKNLFPDPVLPSQELAMTRKPHPLGAKPFDVNVTENTDFILDGDTFTVGKTESDRRDNTNRIRLVGVDTPEYDRPDRRVSEEEAAMAAKSTAYVKELLAKSGTVTVVPMGTGHFGRLLADVVLSDGTSLSKRLVNDRMALDNPNFGKKQIHTTYDHGYDPSEVAALQQAAHESGYVASKVAPDGEVEAERLFELDESGKKLVLPQGEVLVGAGAFYSDIVRGGYDAGLTADTYMGSPDRAMKSLGGALKVLDSTYDGMDNLVLGALVVDPIANGTTKRNLVDKAVGFLDDEDTFGGLVYNKTQSVINAMRTSGDGPMANMLEGIQEQTIHWLLQNRPQDYEGKSPELLAADADAAVFKLFKPIKFSEVSGMHDAYVSVKSLNSAGISDKFLSRLSNSDTVTQKQFAETLRQTLVEKFSANFGESVNGLYIYPPTLLENPDIPDKVKSMYSAANKVFRKFISSGDTGELELLMEQGHIALSFDARDAKTGEQVVVFKVRQENKTWRQSPFKVPLSEFYDVFSNPAENSRLRIKEQRDIDMQGMMWHMP